jgi:acyl-homoserine lactone synthase
MIEIVTKHNAFLFADALEQMFRLRHRVFVERMGWEDLRKPDGREVDQFDTDEAIYMILQDENDQVIASQRYLPSLKPHTLSEVFPHLCNLRGVPAGPRIYEIGRLCTDIDIPRAKRINAKAQLMVGSMEFAQMASISHFSYVGTFELLNLHLSIGWKPLPLGAPLKIEGANTTAFLLATGSEELASAQRYFRLHERLVTYIGPRPVGASMVDYVPVPEIEPLAMN